jgi:hypothetical protein
MPADGGRDSDGDVEAEGALAVLSWLSFIMAIKLPRPAEITTSALSYFTIRAVTIPNIPCSDSA